MESTTIIITSYQTRFCLVGSVRNHLRFVEYEHVVRFHHVRSVDVFVLVSQFRYVTPMEGGYLVVYPNSS